MNGNFVALETTEDNIFGGIKVKDIKNGTTLFLLFVLISAFSAQGAPHFFQLINSSSQSSSSITDSVPLLQKNFPPQHRTPNTGIIPSPNTPRDSITEIVGGQDQFFPGSNIHIRNQFDLYQNDTHNLVIISQVIYIYLFEANVNLTTMIDEWNSSDPTASTYYVHEATTNGSHDIDKAALAYDLILTPTVGFIDTTFQIPDSTTLNAMGIGSDDEVTVFQSYPANNVTESKIRTPINKTDTFTLSSVAIFTSEGFVNDASGDNTFRQGGNATTLLNATSGAIGVPNVTVTFNGLYNKSNDVKIPDPAALDINYEFREVGSVVENSITDGNGFLDLYVNTTYSTPEGDYYFNITADFSGTDFYVENYEKITSTTADFSVLNEWDYVDFVDLQAVPPSLDPPVDETTIVSVRVRAQYTYDTQPYYYPRDIPVNSTLDSYPAGVTLTVAPGYSFSGVPGYYLTDASGYIAFNITAEYPTLYSDIVSNINFIANLTNSLEPNYPYTSGTSPPPHRFLRGAGDTMTIATDQDVSINPDFWVGNIQYSWSNTTSIRPGQCAEFRYEVYSTQTSDIFVDVPVKIELATPIPGVDLHFDRNNVAYGNYRSTDAGGYIYVNISTTYLLTPEIIQTVILNINIDFENDSNLRWIGNLNAIDEWGWVDTLENFNKTWLETPSNLLTIDPDFNLCTIDLSATNDSDDTIRSGDAITATFKVTGGGGDLEWVPVNISFVKSYTGVSMSVIDANIGSPRPHYNYTTATGEVTVLITTTYGITLKDLEIKLNATADFQNDTNPNMWYIGEKPTGVDFRSNRSWSDVEETITVDPQYFIGEIVVKGNPKKIVTQNDTLVIEFELRLREYDTDILVDPLDIINGINGINISILINDEKPEVLGMEVTPASSQYSDYSSVTFSILTNATRLTPEDMYTIEAKADFGGAKGLTYNFTHNTVPTNELSGIWVNGTYDDGYSNITFEFEVKNIDIIRVWIPDGGVTDPYHADAGYNTDSGLYEVYRSTTYINITGTYKDTDTQQAIIGDSLEIRMNHSNQDRVLLATNVLTYDYGFSVIITLPADTPLGDNITIYCEDPTPPTPPEDREGYSDIRVVTSINLNDYTLSNFNGSSVFVGRNVSVSGTLTDNLGMPIDSTSPVFSGSFSELNERIRVVGWNGTHEIGMNVNASPNVDGTYSLYFIVPHNYTIDDTLYIRLNITSPGLVNYRVNYTQELIYVYWDFQIGNFQIHFPFNDTTTNLISDNVYVVTTIDNRDITITGTLQDSTGRGLNAKWINPTWDGNSDPQFVNEVPAGYFSLDYSFTGWENDSWIWQFHHILDNGTILSKYYIVTLQWEVYDKTEPSITITNPIANSTEGVALLRPNDTIMITVTVLDPDSNVVSVGLDLSSVIITINGSSDTMVSSDNTTFSYIWDASNTLDGTYIITIQASDLANNPNETGIMIVFDVTLPTGTIDVTENSEGYLIVDHETGNVTISGTIEDNSSITDWNFGIDTTSARLYINNTQTGGLMINSSISISENSYLYEWGIILDPDDLELLKRNNSFSGLMFEEWTLRITFSDLAGNMNQVERNVTLDNTLPALEIVDNLPDEVDDRLVVNITYNDTESGIYKETLTLELVNSNGTVLDTIRYGDGNVTASDTEATIVLDVSELENGDYKVNIRIFDNTGNKKDAPPESFTIHRPSPSNPLVNMIQLILAPILALGGGIGLAALYERLKGIRSG